MIMVHVPTERTTFVPFPLAFAAATNLFKSDVAPESNERPNEELGVAKANRYIQSTRTTVIDRTRRRFEKPDQGSKLGLETRGLANRGETHRRRLEMLIECLG
jgi:hypothetical protein